ncbi:MAG: DUF2797 domain-containing protein [Bacteroidota bacterium]|nr:DUF2797 domain-containing protein [Bacteroidota bacterium]
MDTELDKVVVYTLNLNNNSQKMNDLIGKEIQLSWKGEVCCSICNRLMKTFYRSRFCYKCYWEAPEASPSIFKPELCTAHLGIEERNLSWEKKFQLSPHYVYLANSSGVKVGITRKTQKLTRWMDQGASQAIILAEVPNRRLSGDIEVALKSFVTDITNWRRMLAGKPNPIDLVKIKDNLITYIPDSLREYVVVDNIVVEIDYPVKEYPIKVKSVKFDKTPIIEGKLQGIKGQYLILDNGRVFNVRSHEGYLIELFSTEGSDTQTKLF